MSRMPFMTMLFVGLALVGKPALAQTPQVGADAEAGSSGQLRVEYVHYRPARWEKDRIAEMENEYPNRGGLVYVYFRNVSDKDADLRFWRANGQDESYWRMNHFVSWDRVLTERLRPGELSILEINAVTDDFGPGKPFRFAYVDGSWRPAMHYEGTLAEDYVQISCIRVLPGMQALEVHVRHTGAEKLRVSGVGVVGRVAAKTDWVGQALDGPGNAIARVTLDQPLSSAQWLVLSVVVESVGKPRTVYAHRRAFEDAFPIGVWSGDSDTYELIRRLHIDTLVKGGNKSDPFYGEVAARYGFRTIVSTGLPVNVDVVRDLGDHPSVLCWMLQDEPDWTTPANVMLFVDETVRSYNATKPTFITLCRNIKFFEYAPISDIPCQDHYSVTAPSSSKWPKPYGTRLEETAWYTRDLKYASEPKPIWVWSQAIADWDERPRRPVPTPNELAAQLILNLGRGAKGILWFNYDHTVAEKYPDVREAMRQWGRVMVLLRDDFLGSETAALDVTAPEKVDVAPLVTWDKLLLCVTNTDYEIHPEAYPFVTKENVEVSVPLPGWIEPAAALLISPDGVEALPCKVSRGKATVTLLKLEACAVIVLPNSADAETRYQAAYQAALAEETRVW